MQGSSLIKEIKILQSYFVIERKKKTWFRMLLLQRSSKGKVVWRGSRRGEAKPRPSRRRIGTTSTSSSKISIDSFSSFFSLFFHTQIINIIIKQTGVERSREQTSGWRIAQPGVPTDGGVQQFLVQHQTSLDVVLVGFPARKNSRSLLKQLR